MKTTTAKLRKLTRSKLTSQPLNVVLLARGGGRKPTRTIDASNFHKLNRIVEFAIEDGQRPVLLDVSADPNLFDEVYFHLRESGYRVAVVKRATFAIALDDNWLDVILI